RLQRDIAASYFQVLSMEQDLKNLAEQAQLYDRRVKDLTARVRRGESNQTDLITAQSTQASLEAETRIVEGDLSGMRENFEYLTGLPRDSQLQDPNQTLTLLPLATYLSAVDKRPDVREAEGNMRSAEKQVSMAWSDHWPRLDATANYYL